MMRSIGRPVWVVFAVLALATVASASLGAAGSPGHAGLASAAAVVLAFVKAALLARHFMETSRADRRLRWGLEALLLACAVALVGLILAA